MHLGVGPSAQYRRWAIKRFAELATAMTAIQPNLTILLTGGGSEQLLMTEFKRHFGGRAIEAADLGGLDRTCALLRRCDLLVSADTGIMHLAAAMAVPTVGLFGPNTPDCWAPVGICATYVYATSRSCSPCINSYRRHIPERCIAETEGACMWDITVNDVLEAARRVVRDHWLS
jgi:heptosyltransferase-2